MTEKEKYMALLTALAELIESKNNTILLQKYHIEDLEEKLKAAESEAASADSNGEGVE